MRIVDRTDSPLDLIRPFHGLVEVNHLFKNVFFKYITIRGESSYCAEAVDGRLVTLRYNYRRGRYHIFFAVHDVTYQDHLLGKLSFSKIETCFTRPRYKLLTKDRGWLEKVIFGDACYSKPGKIFTVDKYRFEKISGSIWICSPCKGLTLRYFYCEAFMKPTISYYAASPITVSLRIQKKQPITMDMEPINTEGSLPTVDEIKKIVRRYLRHCPSRDCESMFL